MQPCTVMALEPVHGPYGQAPKYGVAKGMRWVHSDMYSRLAESYGIYTVPSFLLQYTSHYPLIPFRRCPLHVYCDNTGLVDCICSQTDMQYPCNIPRDNYPIYAEIHQCLQQLKPLELRFFHVKGHQDQQCNKPLTLPKCLNINCNAHAAKLPPYDNPNKIHVNPQTAASYPHLCIKGHVIIRHLQANLRDATTQETYFDYLQNKFQWTTSPDVSIQWQIIQLAFR